MTNTNLENSIIGSYSIINEDKQFCIMLVKDRQKGGEIEMSVEKGFMYPSVVNVDIIVPNKVVQVTFADGTKEKAVCQEPDVFSLESAISICISKRIMGGSGVYNNAIKKAMKVYSDKVKQEKLEKEELERIEKKRAKRKAYMERCAVKRAEIEKKRQEEEKERQIEIQKEAYIRAMEYINAKTQEEIEQNQCI